MHVMLRRTLVAVALLPLAGLAACGSGDAATDRSASILTEAIAYPRRHDAAGFARAALATRLGSTGDLAILEATDLPRESQTDPAVRLVFRIHVPAHQAVSFGDRSTAAFDSCFQVEYLLPSSSRSNGPRRVSCPRGAMAITPPPAPPVPQLPAATADVLAHVLGALPSPPSRSTVEEALQAAFPPNVRVDAVITDGEVAVSAGVGSDDNVQCQVAVRASGRVESVALRPESLLPGEIGCTAALAFLD